MNLPDLARFDRVGLDTETTGLDYGDRPVGLSIAAPSGERLYARWGHEGGGNNCSLAEVIEWSRRELKPERLKKVFFNAAYDLKMLSYIGVELPHNVEDLGIVVPLLDERLRDMSLAGMAKRELGRDKNDDKLNQWCADRFGGQPTRKAQSQNYWRAPGDVVEEYAEDDAELTILGYDKLRPRINEEDLEQVYALETALIPILLKMHQQGVRIDARRAGQVKAELLEKAAELKAQWAREAGDVNYNSVQQLAPLFRSLGLPVWKTEAGNDSITKELLETLDHPFGALVRTMRQVDHYAGTFVDNYLLKNMQPDERIHGEFHQVRRDKYGTISGRFSSGGALNLQNIPARDKIWAPLIRGLFVPDTEDHQWLKADYSQIEYRFFAHYAGGKLADAFCQNPLQDFHQMVADMCNIDRKPAKNVNFAKLYGAGVKRLAATIGCGVDEAQEFLDAYNNKIPEANALYQQAMRRANARGYIITWQGRKARFIAGRRGYEKTYSALNRLLQGSAADLMKLAMVRVANDIVDHDEVRLHLTVHDELDLSVPKGERGLAVARRIKEAMEDYTLDVPVVAEVELGANWGNTRNITS